jgi:hypothetical protein
MGSKKKIIKKGRKNDKKDKKDKEEKKEKKYRVKGGKKLRRCD